LYTLIRELGVSSAVFVDAIAKAIAESCSCSELYAEANEKGAIINAKSINNMAIILNKCI